MYKISYELSPVYDGVGNYLGSVGVDRWNKSEVDRFGCHFSVFCSGTSNDKKIIVSAQQNRGN